MPAAIPYVAAYVYETAIAWGASYATAATIGTVVANVAVYGGLIAGSAAYSNAQARKLKNSLAGKGTTISRKEATASRKIVYGRQQIGGTTIFMHTTGTDNKWAHIVIEHADHECDGFESVKIDDTDFTPDTNGNVVANSGYTYVKTHRGYSGEGAEGELVADSGGYWTTNDKVSGCSYSYVRLQWNQDRFPSGAPNISVLLRGRKVYDPRDEEQDAADDATWVWSENPALCILDYLRDAEYGLGCEDDEIDWAAFIASANTCDEEVYGGKRYTCNGIVDTADAPKSILEDLLTSCAGSLANAGGVWRLIVGADRPVSATFTLDQLRGPLSIQPGDSLRDTCNRVKGVFVGAETQWQPADFPPVTNSLYLSEDGGEEIWRDIELPFTVYSSEAHRLARIELERARQDITVPLPLNLAGYAVTVGDIIRLPFDRYGWNIDGGKLFEVVNHKQVHEQTENGVALGVDIIAREYAPTMFDDGPETTVDLAENTNLPDPRTVENVTGLTTDTASVMQPDGTYAPRLRVLWTVAASEFIKSGGKISVEYKQHSLSTWIVWSEQRGDAGVEYITDAVNGVSYDVRARFRNVFGVYGAYAYANDYTLTIPNPLPPAAVTVYAGDDSSRPRPEPRMFGTTRSQAYAVTVVITPPADPSIAEYHLMGTTTNSATAADLIYDSVGPEQVIVGLTGGYYTLANGTRYLWVRSKGPSGKLSTWVAGGELSAKLKKPAGDLIERDGSAAGSLTGITAWGFTSARRFKTNFRALTGSTALAELARWKPWICDWKTKPITNDVVFIADEIALVRPDAVYRDKEGRIESMDYTKAIPLLVAAVSHQRRQINALSLGLVAFALLFAAYLSR